MGYALGVALVIGTGPTLRPLMMMTTKRLRALADAAGQAGDTLQVAILERAICSDARWDGSLLESLPLTAEERERVLGMTRAEAREEVRQEIALAAIREMGDDEEAGPETMEEAREWFGAVFGREADRHDGTTIGELWSHCCAAAAGEGGAR